MHCPSLYCLEMGNEGPNQILVHPRVTETPVVGDVAVAELNKLRGG